MARYNDDREITFEIVEEIGVISASSTGWKKELNVVSWNGAQGKYDIREWSPQHDRMSRGITLNEQEMRAVIDLLKRRARYGYRRDDSYSRSARAGAGNPNETAAGGMDSAANGRMNSAATGNSMEEDFENTVALDHESEFAPEADQPEPAEAANQAGSAGESEPADPAEAEYAALDEDEGEFREALAS